MAGDYNLGQAEGTIKINYDGTGSTQARKDFKATEDAANKTGAGMDDVGNRTAVAAGVIAAGFGYVANKAIDFEKRISAIGAVSGASADDLDALRQKALQLGSDTAFSASEAALAMEELAKAGLTMQQILGGAADATVALAAAGGVELPEAAELAADAMNSFSLAASDLPKIADNIAGAANASSIGVSEFGQSLKQVGAVAHLAGISFEETAQAIAIMGAAGIKGSDAGTSLKTFLSNLLPSSAPAREAMRELGLLTEKGGNAFVDASGKMKSLADISQILQTATAKLTPTQKQMALETIFGADAIRAAAILTKSGAAGFEGMADAMGKVTAESVASARLDNVAGQIDALKGSAETAAIAYGTLLLPALLKVFTKMTDFANKISSLSETQKNAILVTVAVVGGILALVFVITKIIAAAKLFMVAWRALNASFIASPIGLIITAIILLVAVFYILWTRSSAFRNFFIGMWERIWSVLKAIGAWFAGPFAGFFVMIWGKIWPVLKAIGTAAVAVWNGIVAGVKFAWGIISSVISFFAPLFASVFGLIVAIVKTVFTIIGAIIAVGVALWKALVWPVIMGIWTVISSVLGFIMNAFMTAFNYVRAVITVVWGFIGPYVMQTMRAIWTVIQTALGIIRGIWDVVWSALKATAKFVWDAIVAAVRVGVQTVSKIIDGIKAVVEKVGNFFSGLKKAAEGGVGSLISFVGGIPGKILGALGDLAGLLFGAGKKIIQGLIDGIKNMAGAVKDAVGNVLSKARDMLPFSPAKEGPFSGRGWSRYSGEAIMRDLATGIRVAADLPSLALAGALGVASNTINNSNAGPTVGSVTVNVPAPVSDPNAIARFTARRISTTLATSASSSGGA